MVDEIRIRFRWVRARVRFRVGGRGYLCVIIDKLVPP